MATIVTEKLVRDNITDIMDSKGQHYKSHKLIQQRDKIDFLISKIYEEVEELVEADTADKLTEAADVIEVLYAYFNTVGISIDDIETIRHAKAKARGRFNKFIVLDEYEEI